MKGAHRSWIKVSRVLEVGGEMDLRFALLGCPKPEAIVYTTAMPIAMKAILARRTREIPTSFSPIDFTAPTISSGESSYVKASLNVTAAVVRAVAIAPDTSCENRGKPVFARDCKFHR